jgi:hypothetical protein
MTTKTKLSVLLGIYTGKGFGDTFDDYWEEIVRLSGHNVHNAGVARVGEALKPFLIEQFPWLATFDRDAVNTENVFDVLRDMELRHGEFVEIKPVPSGKIASLNPVEELRFAGFSGEIIGVPVAPA